MQNPGLTGSIYRIYLNTIKKAGHYKGRIPIIQASK